MRTPIKTSSDQEFTMSAAYVNVIFEYLTEKGFDCNELAAEANVQREDPLSRVSRSAFAELFFEAVRLTQNEHLGLHLGERVQPRHYGVISYIALSAPTLRGAIEKSLRYQALVDSVNRVELDEVDGYPALVWEKTVTPDLWQLAELDVVSWVSCARWGIGPTFNPFRVDLCHVSLSKTDEYIRVFGCPLRFNAPRYALLFEQDLLSLPMGQPNPALQELMESHARRLMIQTTDDASQLERIRTLISQRLTDGEPTLESIAGSLELGPRTLQRKLADAGLTLSKLVDEVRMELAKRYLHDPEFQISEAAFLLGFSEQSSLQRAFKRWTGTTPAKWRNSNM